MRLKSESGLTLVELLVIVGVVFFLLTSVTWCPSSAVMQANMTAVGIRGKDIYVAVTAANAEREPLGLPPLWPRDFDPVADTNSSQLAELDFDSSTAYFKWLLDEPRMDTEQWNPRVAGIDYSKLAGAGVPACSDRKLTAANNMWTVAKNVRGDMEDLIPIFITRNIEASSLAASVAEVDLKTKSLRFGPGWNTPFSYKGYVMIRKGGAIFKARRKYVSYAVVYQDKPFDTAHSPDRRAAPLKYLTPTREVVPSEQAYLEGAAIAYCLAGGWVGRLLRDMREFSPIARFFAVIYLLAFVGNLLNRKRLGLRPLTSAPVIGVWVCHYLAFTFYVVGIMFGFGGDEWAGASIVAALVALTLGVVLALMFQRHDRETRRRQIKWLLATFLCFVLASCLFPSV